MDLRKLHTRGKVEDRRGEPREKNDMRVFRKNMEYVLKQSAQDIIQGPLAPERPTYKNPPSPKRLPRRK